MIVTPPRTPEEILEELGRTSKRVRALAIIADDYELARVATDLKDIAQELVLSLADGPTVK